MDKVWVAVGLFVCTVFSHGFPFILFFWMIPPAPISHFLVTLHIFLFYLLIIVSISVTDFLKQGRQNYVMTSLFNARCSTTLSRTSSPDRSWKSSFQLSAVRRVNLRILLKRFHRLRCYSSENYDEASSRRKRDHIQQMADMEEFFVVRKGDIVGVYRSLSDCQALAGTTVASFSSFDMWISGPLSWKFCALTSLSLCYHVWLTKCCCSIVLSRACS